MKKLLILMLVLGLTTVANATLQLSVNGVTDGPSNITDVYTINGQPVIPCTEIVIDVHGPAGYAYSAYLIIEAAPDSAAGEWGDNLGPPYTHDSGYYNKTGYPIVYAAAGDMGGTMRFLEWNYGDDNWGFGYLMTAAQGIGPVPGGLEFDYMFHCRAPGDVKITLWDVAVGYESPQDTVIVHQVPEPATMLLLGIGGLLLRRRR